MSELDLEFLFEARVQLDAPIMVGPTPEGTRMIVNVLGGTFEGPNIRGRVMPNTGADWARLRSDGSGALDVRFCLETEDQAILYAHWHGIMMYRPEDQAYAMDFAKPDDPAGADRYYFRTAPRFETAHADYAWLNHTLCVSKSRTGDGGVIHRIFAVK
ncbi:MAG: DUF3237 domain-containing protein [Pseudomonadota bacterium]